MVLKRPLEPRGSFGFTVLGRPVAAGLILNGAYVAEKYPPPTQAFEFSARNVGKTWPGWRSPSFSIATTLPIFGAMLPSAAAGLRPICVQAAPGCGPARAPA